MLVLWATEVHVSSKEQGLAAEDRTSRERARDRETAEATPTLAAQGHLHRVLLTAAVLRLSPSLGRSKGRPSPFVSPENTTA